MQNKDIIFVGSFTEEQTETALNTMLADIEKDKLNNIYDSFYYYVFNYGTYFKWGKIKKQKVYYMMERFGKDLYQIFQDAMIVGETGEMASLN